MEKINSELKIVRLGGKKFKIPQGYAMCSGFGLCHNDYGFIAFNDSPLTPYVPQGGKKTLERILNQGGFNSFEGMCWVKEMKE